ncbi:MAG: GTP-dependent dephospho-CoA kinase family protein [Candidatus Bathycorpusculaceae bacterium]
MDILYTLTPELRIRLKKPLGMLIRGSYTETMKKLLDMTKEEKPPTIISVGDTVSKNIAENHLLPQLAIVDNKVMRRKIQPIPTTAEKTIHVKNPPGTITEEAITAIQEALKSNCHAKIIVDGEEDLLTLVAVLYAPQNSFVVYGQPYEGIVIIKVTQEKKAEVSEILKAMENARKTK